MYVGSFTQAATGSVTLSIGFKPSHLRFTISQLAAGPENAVAHLSTGFTDGTTQYAHSIYADGNNAFTRINNGFCLSHYAIINNAFTRVISAADIGRTATGFTLSFDRASGAYLITFEALP